MKDDSLKFDVAEYVKAVDDIFERQLKLILEVREALRLIVESLQKVTCQKELPPLEEVGVNSKHFSGGTSHSEVRKNKPDDTSRLTLTP